MKWTFILIVVCTLLPQRLLAEQLVVHEWGTFTVLQDEEGNAIGGINTDDEPVPGFVHDIARMTGSLRDLPTLFDKVYPHPHPDITVRLETPVIYFYPPKGADIGPIDVKVSFHGGWLTQFYPKAQVQSPALKDGLNVRSLNGESIGTLAWPGLRLGGSSTGPQTKDRVWLAPRQVKAAMVTNESNEHERYLFYRGVGQVNAPLRISREGENLVVRSQWGNFGKVESDSRLGPLLLIDARADGTSAFRTVDSVSVARGGRDALATLPATFAPSEYNATNLTKIRAVLHDTLVREGLFGDEAEAMLNTWEVSYFKRPGLRLFFPVPRAWTEQYLPLSISPTADVTRVMIGRIEIVTPEQRTLLRKIAAGPASKPNWTEAAMKAIGAQPTETFGNDAFTAALDNKRSLLEGLSVNVPDDYRAFLAMGRFRMALVNDESKRRPSKDLNAFIDAYGLREYKLNGA